MKTNTERTVDSAKQSRRVSRSKLEKLRRRAHLQLMNGQISRAAGTLLLYQLTEAKEDLLSVSNNQNLPNGKSE